MNILFSINQKFIEQLCQCLYSIVKNGGALSYNVYILHSDLNHEQRSYIEQKADKRVIIYFIKVDETIFQGFPETKRYPKEIYYRLVSPLLLPRDLDKILYLDVDTIIINSLSDLYQMDFQNNYYIACSHVKEFLTKCNQIRLEIKDDVPYINTGVLMMNLPALRNHLSIDFIRTTVKKKTHSFLLPDQDLLTIMHGKHILLTDTIRYNLSDRILNIYNMNHQNHKIDISWVRKNCTIIHYCGKNKPWLNHYKGILDIFYKEIENEYKQ